MKFSVIFKGIVLLKLHFCYALNVNLNRIIWCFTDWISIYIKILCCKNKLGFDRESFTSIHTSTFIFQVSTFRTLYSFSVRFLFLSPQSWLEKPRDQFIVINMISFLHLDTKLTLIDILLISMILSATITNRSAE